MLDWTSPARGYDPRNTPEGITGLVAGITGVGLRARIDGRLGSVKEHGDRLDETLEPVAANRFAIPKAELGGQRVMYPDDASGSAIGKVGRKRWVECIDRVRQPDGRSNPISSFTFAKSTAFRC
jgi:hypothetical protein